MVKMNNFLLSFCRIIYGKCPAEKPGDGISETLNFKLFWGNMPPDPPSCKRLRRLGKIYSRAYIFKIPRYAPNSWRKMGNYSYSSILVVFLVLFFFCFPKTGNLKWRYCIMKKVQSAVVHWRNLPHGRLQRRVPRYIKSSIILFKLLLKESG